MVSWNFASILRRSPVICDYPIQWEFLYGTPKMAHFGRSIRPRWTHFLASVSNTEVSLRSFWHTLLLPPSLCTFWVTWRVSMVTAPTVTKEVWFLKARPWLSMSVLPGCFAPPVGLAPWNLGNFVSSRRKSNRAKVIRLPPLVLRWERHRGLQLRQSQRLMSFLFVLS